MHCLKDTPETFFKEYKGNFTLVLQLRQESFKEHSLRFFRKCRTLRCHNSSAVASQLGRPLLN